MMTWNILASGMANDGFLLARAGESDKALRSRLLSTVALARRVKDAHRQAELLKGKFKLDSSFAQEVVMQWPDAPPSMKEDWDKQIAREKAELVKLNDWSVRGDRLVQGIAIQNPNVLVLQECDKYEFFCQRLAQLGYSSKVAGKTSIAYTALKASHFQPDADYSEAIAEIASHGIAFAPKKDSVARRLSHNDLVDFAPDDDGVAIFWKKINLRL